MATGKNFVDAIADVRASGKDITFAELLAMVLKDKIVEIYLGETYEDLKFQDSGSKSPSVLVGKIITAYAECIVLDCVYVDLSDNNPDYRQKRLKFGNIVCLNERAIRTVTEVDDRGGLKDTFLSTRDGRIVKAVSGG